MSDIIAQTVMLPRIEGRTKTHKTGDNRRTLETFYGDSGLWILKLSRYRPKENKAYSKDVLVLYSSELDELTRWWSEVKKAVK